MITKNLLRVIAATLVMISLIPAALATTLTLPPGTTRIEESAFQGIGGLTVVVIPESVMYIGSNAFADCTGITDIYVENANVTLGENALGDGANVILHRPEGSVLYYYARESGMRFKGPKPSDPSPEKAAKLLAYAATQLGTPYSQHDCVLFVRECYREALGITTYATCIGVEQYTKGTRIDEIADLRPGDIICWNDPNHAQCTHVGLYVGEGVAKGVHYNSGVFIESSYNAQKVQYNYIYTNYYTTHFMGAWRLL